MKSIRLLGLLLLCPLFTLFAQTETVEATLKKRSWLEGGAQKAYTPSPPLPYAPLREADVMWEKRVWRIIDTREKMNLPFRYPAQTLFSIIEEGMEAGAITAYSAEDDQFSVPMSWQDVMDRHNTLDTIFLVDPVSGEYRTQIVQNTFNPDQIIRWRVQEVWYFDSKYSTMRVRIIGLAPILDSYGENGDKVRYSIPMFWINYAEARDWLARYPVPQWSNTHAATSWEDLFEMRRFSSYIYQEGDDMHGRRLKDYLSGPDLLQRSAEIEQTIHNYEGYLWEH